MKDYHAAFLIMFWVFLMLYMVNSCEQNETLRDIERELYLNRINNN